MYITDLRHFAGAVEDPSAPAQAKQMALFFNAIVEDGRDVHRRCPQCNKAGVIHDYEDARTAVGVR